MRSCYVWTKNLVCFQSIVNWLAWYFQLIHRDDHRYIHH